MTTPCSSCQKLKAGLHCGLCECTLCKACTQFVDEETFSYLPKLPKELAHQTYCAGCYEQKVRPQIDLYEANMKRARDIVVFSKKESKITRLVKRLEPALHAENCLDEQEATMRLAFLAVLQEFNVLIDFEVRSEKVKNGSYQKLVWKASAIPVNIDVDKLPKMRQSNY